MRTPFDLFPSILSLLSWPQRSPENPTNDGAINAADEQTVAAEAPESALLQEEDLEAGPQIAPEHETSSQSQQVTRDLGAAGIGLMARLHSPNQTTGESGRRLVPWTGTNRVSIREANRRTDLRSSSKLKDHLNLSFFLISTAAGVLVSLFVVRTTDTNTDTKPISKSPSLIVASASAFVSLVSGFWFMIDTMRQMGGRRNQELNNPPRSWYKLLLCLSLMSLAFTVLSLVASFLPKTYYCLPLVLLPTLLPIGTAFYDVCWSDDGHVLPGGNNDDDPHKADRKRSVQLAISMAAFSFMGALGSAIGYKKNYSNRSDHISVKVSLYLMIGAAVTGLVTLLINGLLRGKDWKRVAVGNVTMLVLLVPSVLIIAATFLGRVLAGTPFPVVISAVVWYFINQNNNGAALDAAFTVEKELKPLYTVALTASSVSFGAIISVFSGFLGGGEGKGKTLEVTIFAVVSSFLSAVSLGILTFRTPKKASVAAAARALACFTLVLIVLAALALVTYVG